MDPLIPTERAIMGVETDPDGVRDIDRKAAAAFEREVEEGGGLCVVWNGFGKGCIESCHFGGRSAEMIRQIAQVVVETKGAGGVVIALDAGEDGGGKRQAVRIDDGAEGLREGFQFRAVHQRDGAGAVGARLGVVVFEILAAIGLQVGFRPGEHVPGQGLVDHSVGQDLRGRDDQTVAFVLELPGQLHAAGQAVVEDEVVQVHGDRRGEILHLDPADVVVAADVLVADGFGLGPGVLRLLPDAADGGAFAVAGIACRDPAGAVGGEEHAVTVRRETGLHVLQGAPQEIGGSADGDVVVDLESVRDGASAGAPVDPDHAGGIGTGIVAGAAGQVADAHDGLVPGKTGEDVRAEGVEVGPQVGGEVVVTQAVIDQDLVIGPLERTLNAVAGGQYNRRQNEEKSLDAPHRLQIYEKTPRSLDFARDGWLRHMGGRSAAMMLKGAPR